MCRHRSWNDAASSARKPADRARCHRSSITRRGWLAAKKFNDIRRGATAHTNVLKVLAHSWGTDSGTITGGDVAAGRDAGGGEGDGGPISDTGETFLVPMYEENASSAGILESGVAYIISVGGTYSLWPSTDWTLVCAGTPESAPEFSTSESGPVSNDAEWLFAWPMIASFCARGAVPPVAFHALQFAVDGSTYVPLQPSEKLLTADHVYHYSVIGAGSPLGIYVTDGVNAWDNYGALQVTITR